MNKITLKNVYLLNWYGFVDKRIPLGDNLTLITGENECGKSTILDAIKYAFSGDTEFNKATSATKVGTGKRTLASYTRCLIDPDKGKCARNNQTHPFVYTHIALHYYNELFAKDFVLGVVIETNASDDTNSNWYCCDDKTLDDIHFYTETNDGKYALSAKQFRDINRCELMNKSNGLVKFMNMTGLKLQGEQILKYQRKLRNIMTYNPEAKIQQFIKESVLEAKNVDLTKLKTQKKNIDELNATFTSISDEIQELETILNLFNDYHLRHARLIKDDAKIVYKQLVIDQESLVSKQRSIEDNQQQINQLSQHVKQLDSQKETKNNEYMNARMQQEKMDGYHALKDEKDTLANLENQVTALNEKCDVVKQCYLKIADFKQEKQLSFALVDYNDPSIETSKKITNFNTIKREVSDYYDNQANVKFTIEHQLSDVQQSINQCNAIIKSCDQNLPDYSKVSGQMKLVQEINHCFKQKGIDSLAKFACSYVVELKDEKWRNSIECFLGIHRYAILVEPKYFSIANDVMDKSSAKYGELINTPLLMNKEFSIENDSLLHQLDIKNQIAHHYFAYWLGKIHAVDNSEVVNYENAISPSGKMSRNMAITYLNFKKIDSYCLGEDAIQLNKQKALKEKQSYELVEKECYQSLETAKRNLLDTKVMMELLAKDYDMDASNALVTMTHEIHECKLRISELEKALKHNTEYLLLVERIAAFEAQLKQINTQLGALNSQLGQLKGSNVTLKDEVEKLTVKCDHQLQSWQAMRQHYPSESAKAKEEYDNYRFNIKSSGDVMLADSRATLASELSKAEQALAYAQGAYNARKDSDNRLAEGLDKQVEYSKRKQRLEVDNLELIKEKLQTQLAKYESIFKNEFVMKIKANVEAAISDIKDINKQLKLLQFNTKYQFEVKEVKGLSDFARILEYGSYLQVTNRIDNGKFTQMALGDVVNYDDDEAIKREDEIKVIVNRILSKDNDAVLLEFADYRNYMEYEVIVDDGENSNLRLSRIAGYNSGAGTQIPYTIILSAALALYYNARSNSTRLIFIDEPFEKMSDKNIKSMLEFFKSQNFQVIFCAPPNRLDSIGKECDAIIPIQRINKSNMTLGVIKFNG